MKKNTAKITETRFEMIKKRHYKTLEKAIEQGLLDPKIKSIALNLQKKGNCFTSSSCSGRIVLLQQKTEKKGDSYFYRKWHRPVSLTEAWTAIKTLKKNILWFKQEPFILHLCVKNKENAEKVLLAKNKAGIKRGGIITIKPGLWLIELTGTQTISFPVKKNKKLLIQKKGFAEILRTANKKLEKNFEQLKKLGRELQKKF